MWLLTSHFEDRIFFFIFAEMNMWILKMRLEVAYFWVCIFFILQFFCRNFLTFQKLSFYSNYSKCIRNHFIAKMFNARICKTIKTCILILFNKLKTIFAQIEGGVPWSNFVFFTSFGHFCLYFPNLQKKNNKITQTHNLNIRSHKININDKNIGLLPNKRFPTLGCFPTSVSWHI